MHRVNLAAVAAVITLGFIGGCAMAGVRALRHGLRSRILDDSHQGCFIRRYTGRQPQKVLAYLEATSGRNVPLYERHGFEALGRIHVTDSPLFIPMMRKPR